MEENDDRLYRVWSRGWKPILCELSAIIIGRTTNCPNNGTANNVINNGITASPSWDIKTKALIVSQVHPTLFS